MTIPKEILAEKRDWSLSKLGTKPAKKPINPTELIWLEIMGYYR